MQNIVYLSIDVTIIQMMTPMAAKQRGIQINHCVILEILRLTPHNLITGSIGIKQSFAFFAGCCIKSPFVPLVWICLFKLISASSNFFFSFFFLCDLFFLDTRVRHKGFSVCGKRRITRYSVTSMGKHFLPRYQMSESKQYVNKWQGFFFHVKNVNMLFCRGVEITRLFCRQKKKCKPTKKHTKIK